MQRMTDEINQNDDVVFEPEEGKKKPADVLAETDGEEFVAEDGEGNAANPQDAVRALREKLKKAVAEKQEYLDGWQRARADLINARKRDEEDKKQFLKFANESLIVDLVPVLESFDMARANTVAWESIDKNWRVGVEHIHSQLLKVLTDNGLQELCPKGEKFDPMRDEAVSYEPVVDEKLEHTVIDVIQKGYSLNGKILKAPRVKVGEFKKKE